MRFDKRSFIRAVAAIGGCVCALALFASSAAAIEITRWTGSFASGGQLSRQAGAHPDFTTILSFDQNGVRNAVIDLPPGVLADGTNAPTCPSARLTAGFNGKAATCPANTQVGILGVEINFSSPKNTQSPVYNVERPADAPALFVANVEGVLVRLKPQVRSGDYGITVDVDSISQALQITGSELELWGVPADPVHDPDRWLEGSESPRGVPSTAPRLPFVLAPTACSGRPLSFGVAVDSWYETGVFKRASFTSDAEGTPLSFENCGRLPFAPAASAALDSRAAGGPAGFSLDLRVPQNEAPYGLAAPQVRKVAVTLPPGFEVSAAAAGGLGGCSPAQIGLGTSARDTCPAAATIGDVAIASPLIDEDLRGRVVLANQGDNPFGTLLALYLVVEGPGVLLKLPGRVDLDPASGQVTATFAETPQLPFEELRVSLRGGPGAPLVAPSACGTYAASVQMTSWASSDPVALRAPITVDQGCAGGGFAPGLQAGTVNARGGAFSPFVLRVTREDRESNLSRVAATLPEGLLAKLAGVPLCGDAAAAVGACPADSGVGSVTLGVGAGASSLYIPQAGRAPTAVYLAGPYKGAPYSLVAKVPAQAGPFDLGTVVVRSALRVDPTTTRVTAESDPLPQILEGIPIAYRDLRVVVDRPRFTLNPTSCEQQQVTSALTSVAGQVASPSARFAAGSCERLGFAPRLSLKISGQTKRSGNPALRAVLRAPAGEANIAETSVVLPRSFFIDNAHISNPCTRVQFDAGRCPKSSVLGTAVAKTPLLDKPLRGPVYFRSNGGARELPDLVADLGGQIHVTLVGFIDSVKVGREGSRVRTRFADVPDAPVSKFVLRLKGGKRGLIENSQNLCASTQRAKVAFVGQNGKRTAANRKIATGCGRGGKR